MNSTLSVSTSSLPDGYADLLNYSDFLTSFSIQYTLN